MFRFSQQNIKFYLFSFSDANKIVSSLPVLHSEYQVADDQIVFLRRFFRSHDTQTLMKVSSDWF